MRKSAPEKPEELEYLARLTRCELKPLSRWELPVDGATRASLERQGLRTRVVHRSTRSGRRVTELLFSRDERCLDLYADRFEGRPVQRTADDMRFEGWLFGYPSCCVESYIAHGYRPNAVPRADQRILFHWACPHCALTPLLVPHYRRILEDPSREDVPEPMAGSQPAPMMGAIGRSLRHGLAMAASLAALAVTPLPHAAPPPDPHQVPLDLREDPDQDGLTDAEESRLGLDPAVADQDANGIADGADWARRLFAAVEALPLEPSAWSPYRRAHLTFGLESCEVCGTMTNMGFYEVIDPLGKLSTTVPCMALHYLEHGAFAYRGSEHQGRLDVPLLHTVLSGPGQAHFVPGDPTIDQDRDGLHDREELDLRTNPEQADENANQIPDGVDFALECAGRIANLPTKPSPDQIYRLDFEVKGLEQCGICGAKVNMGHLTLCNPRAQLFANLTYNALHHLEHGSLAYVGDVHGAGRLDPLLLLRTLDAKAPNHAVVVPGDSDQDGLADAEEKHFRTDPAKPDSHSDGVADGFRVPRDLWGAIVALTRDAGSPVHAVDHLLRGLVTCPVCGTQENMGYVELVNTREAMSLQVTYLALHYLRHGSLGTGTEQRLNPRLVDLALHGDGTSHLVTLPGDTDLDGLLDVEEQALGTRPDQADSNHDGVLDGVAAARSAFERIQELPREVRPDQAYALHAEADCYEPCLVCGVDVNCGHVELVQPWAELQTRVSYRLLHFLEHGSFAASVDERISPLRLEAFLRPSLLIGSEGPHRTLRWFGAAGRKYQIYEADSLSGPWTAGAVFQGADGMIEFDDPDGGPTARRFYRVTTW